MTSGTRTTFSAAIKRAWTHGGATAARPIGRGTYRVIGSTGTTYTVRVDARGEYECSCAAGQQGRPCWHQGATWILRTFASPLDQCPSDAERRVLVTSATRIQMREWDQ